LERLAEYQYCQQPFYGHKPKPGVFYRFDYHEAKSAGECPSTTAAIMVEGKQAGRKLCELSGSVRKIVWAT
jgi:hypothetical protein